MSVSGHFYAFSNVSVQFWTLGSVKFVRNHNIPTEFQHSHPSDYPLRTLSAVFMRFRPSSDNWVHFGKKSKWCSLGMLHRQNAEKEGKKRELYFKPSPILREPPSEREKTLEGRKEVLNTFTFSSAPDAILYLLSMLRHCRSYPCTCGRAISHQTGLWKKKNIYIYIRHG